MKATESASTAPFMTVEKVDCTVDVKPQRDASQLCLGWSLKLAARVTVRLPISLRAAPAARCVSESWPRKAVEAHVENRVVRDPVEVRRFTAQSVPADRDDITQENYAAVACALHNVSLAGVAEGLAVTWETGGIAKLPGLTEAVGGDPGWALVAMATVGYPDEESPSSRTPVSEFVTWAE